jgi:carbonic anhydrase
MKILRLAVIAVVGCLTIGLLVSRRAQFIAGGALVNLGYRLQDPITAYDFEHEHDISPTQVWEEFRSQNGLASSVRRSFPRSTYHPLVALLVCMDARLDTNELTGDTRRNAYVVRTAGSVMSPKEEDMLELAVTNGVELIVLSRHSDCAAEKAAGDPALRARFPALVTAVDERQARVTEFLARPVIAERIANGTLLVKELLIDTANEHVEETAPTN